MMTYEEKKEYLRGFLHARRAAEDAVRRLEEFRSANAGIKAVVISDMPRATGQAHDLSEYVAKLDDLEAALWDAVVDYRRLAEEVEGVISTEANATHQRLLRLRYIDGMTFERIAVEMGYSWRQVMRLHYLAVMDLNLS